MLFTSFSQIVALIVLFFAGLALGFGLHPGGKRWRQRFKDESENYARFRRDADKRLREAKLRITELERANTTRREHDAVVDRQPFADAPAPGLSMPIAAAAAVPAFFYPREPAPVLAGDATAVQAAVAAPQPPEEAASDGSSDLARIRGIDTALGARLAELGVTRYDDITELSAVDEMALERRLALPAGYIAGEQWRDQAALLRDDRDAEQAERFPPR